MDDMSKEDMKISLPLIMFLSGLIVVPGLLTAYGDGSNVLSPYAQVAAGIAAEDVACREGLQLMIRNNGDAICVSEQIAQRLADAGIAMTAGYPDSGTKYELMKDAVLSVTNALALYDEHGEDAFEIITALNVEDHAYPWVITSDTAVEMADGSILDRSGMKVWSDIELEAAVGGVREILNGGDGAWITYVFLNPATGMDEAKMSWILQRDGHLFGSGFYIEGQKAKMLVSDWSIRKAITAYNQLGMEDAFASITAMESSREIYPFVIGMDGIISAHGAIPSHVGEQSVISMLDNWENILADLAETGKATASYEFTNPATDAVEPKQALLVLHDGHIFGSGFYNLGNAAEEAVPEDTPTLTDSEMAWLEKNDTIRVGYDPGWQPVEYVNDSGEIDGLAAWYMVKIEEYTGADLEKVDGISTWAEALDVGRNGDADIFLMIMDIEGRHDFLEFTLPHLILPTDMITLGTKDIDNSDFSGFKIAYVQGYAIESWFDERHPDADYVSFDDVPSALRAVANGDADMYIESWVIVSHMIDRYGIGGLADSGPSGYSYNFSVGVQKDNPILKSIMQKAVDSIPEDEKMQFLDTLS